MKLKTFASLFVVCTLIFCAHTGRAEETVRIEAPISAPRLWECSEFKLSGVPAAANPYDPDVIAVDATFKGPSGKEMTLPAFWYQPYSRALTGDAGKQKEVLTSAGEAGWRLRWTPLEMGANQCRVVVTQAGKAIAVGQSEFKVGARAQNDRGFVRAEPKRKHYFQTEDGRPLPLLGENLCWHHERGTYDYDDWFAGFERGGMNYTRLWMSQNAFGLEFFGKDRLNYNQESAWRLDYVLDEAKRKGIYIMLCFDYHGIFQVDADHWGSNNFWPKHAYNQINGGPCATQNDFFTNEEAKSLYRKRLRYIIARYSGETSLLSWQFFNEINNVYRYLKPTDVIAWHAEMARWVKQHDPYQHLRTTSFGSAGEEPAMWNIPELDYTLWHWYANYGGPYTQPAVMAADVAKHFQTTYGKPFYIGEFGTTTMGGKAENDPDRRGLQQAIWGGIMGGGAGTAMPWWWEWLHEENLYPLWGALHKFLEGTNLGTADWHQSTITAPKEVMELGEPIPNGQPFEAQIPLGQNPVHQPEQALFLRSASDGDSVTLKGYVYGHSKPERMSPLKIEAVLGANAKMILHLNSVSDGATLVVKSNGQEVFRRVLPNKDNSWERNNEYNEDIEVAMPAGRQNIEIINPDGDWFLLDWIRFTNVLPTQPRSPDGVPLDGWAMTDGQQALVWLLDPRFNYPRGAKSQATTVTGAVATLHNMPDGNYQVQWWHTREGRVLGTTKAQSRKGVMKLAAVPFQTDIAARVKKVR